MALFKKKPVVIEARQFKSEDDLRPLVDWINDEESIDLDHFVGAWHDGGKIHIPTLEGVMTADEGDFIIKGIQDEFYPCKPDIFNDSYEEVNQ